MSERGLRFEEGYFLLDTEFILKGVTIKLLFSLSDNSRSEEEGE